MRRDFVDCIRTTPGVSGCGRLSDIHGRLSDIPAHFDMALIWAEDEGSNEATKWTYLDGAFDFILVTMLFKLTHFTLLLERASCWTSAAYFCPPGLFVWSRSPQIPHIH